MGLIPGVSGRPRIVLLCGGAGRRLWPLSRPDRPKPLLPLAAGRTLLADSVARFAPFGTPWVVCGSAHASAVRREVGAARLLVEPVPRGTAAAVLAAAALADPDELLLISPADHHVRDPAALRDAIVRGIPAAEAGAIVLFGITADRAETGFGWIALGRTGHNGVFAAERFIEKPPLAQAQALLTSGACWNSGMFLFRAGSLQTWAAQHCRAMTVAVKQAVQNASRSEFGDWWLDQAAFETAETVSFDVAVVERFAPVAVVPVSCGWSDVGTWPAVRAAGQASMSEATLVDSPGAFVLSDGAPVVVVGVPDVTVVVSADGVLVAARDRPTEALPALGPVAILDRGTHHEVRRRLVAAGESFDVEDKQVVTLVQGRCRAVGVSAVDRGVLSTGRYEALEASLLVITDLSRG